MTQKLSFVTLAKPYLTNLSLELRKRLQYRVDFWLNNFFIVFGYLFASYALWNWIYEKQDVSELNGYSFHKMMWYYVLSSFLLLMTRPKFEIVAGDIYTGNLSKYLLYPISYFGLKLSQQLSYFLMTIVQFFITLLFFHFVIGLPVDDFTLKTTTMGFISVFFTLILYFAISMNLELLGFWFEGVWAITYMFQYIAEFFGGKMVPFSFFPEWSLKILSFLPFNFLFSFPSRAFLGNMGFEEWFFGSIISLIWIVFFSYTTSLLWRSGLKNYSGVGI